MQFIAPTPEEVQGYSKMSQLYPVCINGNWYNPEDIDKPIPESEWGSLRIKAKVEERFKQAFYNQILYTLLYNWSLYESSNGFNAILKYTEVLRKAICNAMKLYGRDDYAERSQKALQYSCYDLGEGQNQIGIDIVLSPVKFETYYKIVTTQYFRNDIEYWNRILNNYKQQKAYNNRLKYLIDYMDKLEQLNILFLQEQIKAQREIYKQQLKTNSTNNVTK